MSTSEFFNQLKIGWRALGRVPEGKELQSISVISNHSVKLRAGRLAENNAETALFRFDLEHYPQQSSLPRANGFNVRLFRISDEQYIGISRTEEGQLDLFEAMLVDVMSHVMQTDGLPHKIIFKRFMDRVQAWQAFMGRGKKGLSRKDELGLMGELIILRKLLTQNLPANDVIKWWRGPLHGIQDFQMFGSAIEVKASLSDHGFEIDVFDVEQLDPSGLQMLYLSAVRLKPSTEGETLPQMIQSIKTILKGNPDALNLFEIALNYSGYSSLYESDYSLATSVEEVIYFEVDQKFPSLRRKDIPVEVGRVKYSIEVDLLTKPENTLEEALKKIGVMIDGT